MSNPVAIIVSDVHYNINTLKIADNAMRQAIEMANKLDVTLIVAGDLHDTKAMLRGECISAMIETFKTCKNIPFVLVGNHDRIHEQNPEHSLEFLRPYCILIDTPKQVPGTNLHLIPYYSDPQELERLLNTVYEGSTLIMHQGVMGSNQGHYIQDKSAVHREAFADFRVISGHYHQRQDIKCGRPRKGAVGLFSYIGNPYTLNFGEAHDPSKGFRILRDDGILDFVPTNLRKHVVIEVPVERCETDSINTQDIGTDDLIWLKVTGPYSELKKLNKAELGNRLFGRQDYKLDLIYTDKAELETTKTDQTQEEILDQVIDSTAETAEQKSYLKSLWRDLA